MVCTISHKENFDLWAIDLSFYQIPVTSCRYKFEMCYFPAYSMSIGSISVYPLKKEKEKQSREITLKPDMFLALISKAKT